MRPIDLLDREPGGRVLLGLPRNSDPTWILPADSRDEILAALATLHPAGRKGRATSRIIRIAHPMLRHFPPMRLSASVTRLTSFLSDSLNMPVESVVLSRARGGERIAIVALAMDGHPLAYGKAGAKDDEGVTKEARNLGSIAASPGLQMPRLLAEGNFGDLRMILTSPLEGRRIRAGGLNARDVATLARMLAPIAERAVSDILSSEVPTDDDLDNYRRWFSSRLGHIALPWGRIHGDFAPWNALRVNQDLGLVDWEDAGEGPALHDLCHWVVRSQTHLQPRKRSIAAGGGVRSLPASLLSYSDFLGMDDSAMTAAMVTYLLHPLARGTSRGEHLATQRRLHRYIDASLAWLARQIEGA